MSNTFQRAHIEQQLSDNVFIILSNDPAAGLYAVDRTL
jgi:hypothetical protein